jgi:hypothetical protein
MSIRTLGKNTVSLSRNLGYDKVGKYLTKRQSIFGAVQGESKGRFYIQYLVVGGGGGGGSGGGGGGGGGGIIIGVLDAAPVGNLSVGPTGETYGVSIAGVTGNNTDAVGGDGSRTTFGPFQAFGGGGGGRNGGYDDGAGANRGRTDIAAGGGQGQDYSEGRSMGNMGGRGGVAYPGGKTGPGQSASDAIDGLGGSDRKELYWSSCYSVGDHLFIGGSQNGGNELITEGMYVFVENPSSGGTGGVPIAQYAPGTIISGTYNVTSGAGPAQRQVKNGGGRDGEYQIGKSDLVSGGAAQGSGVSNTFASFDTNQPRGSPSVTFRIMITEAANALGVGGGGGGAATSGSAPRGGEGGSGYSSSLIGFSRTYGPGGGGSSTRNVDMAESRGGGGCGKGQIQNNGPRLYDGGTSPGNSSTKDGNGNPSVPSQIGWPLPPFGNQSGYGGTDGTSDARNALNNRGGGGGGQWNGSSRNDYGPFGQPVNLWSQDGYPPPNASAPLWPTSTGTRNWPGRTGYRTGGRGGSGIVIIKYPIAFGNVSTTGSPITTVTDDGFLVYQFVDSGSIKFDYTP